MIIMNLAGGLGNQMFQYALGRKMSIKNGDTFKLDDTTYRRGFPRPYSLSHFTIVESIATPEEIRRLKLPYGFFSRVERSFKARILRIFNVEFSPKILEKKGDMYLDGFWQSEKYFSDIADTIRKDFTLKEKMSPAGESASRKISAEKCPVSLHVRRGDYVSHAKTNSIFGTCSPEYYRKAVSIIREKAPDARFFVFSDDIAWAKENLELPENTVFVSDPAIRDYEELVLMSRCGHHIIANSSFSWWGAWLDPNPEKVVIAPARWFNGSPKVYKDVVPDSWIKI